MKNVLLVAALAIPLALAACSEKTKENASATADSAAMDAQVATDQAQANAAQAADATADAAGLVHGGR